MRGREEGPPWTTPGPVTGQFDVRGDSSLLERYFVLVPPV
jgi:hypothetical protein